MNINETYKQLKEVYNSIKELEKELNSKDEEITKLKEEKKMLLAQLTRLQNSGGSNGGTVEEPVETVTVISNNKIVNGTNENSNNIEYAEDYKLNKGIVKYTHSDGNSFFTWDLTETLQSGTAYKLLLDISNIGGNARFRLFANNDGALTQLIGNTTYNNGTNTLNFTPEVNVSKLSLSTSSASTSFDFDNAILLLENEDIEYEEVPSEGGSETPVEEGVFAFPSAYGAGADAVGGRGGIVVHITNRNDSGEGSLRSALVDYQDKDRTIVSDVSGVIELQSDIVLSSPEQGGTATGKITFAGQTAPLGGLTITGGKIRMFGVDDVIWRYTKFRETTATDGCLSNTDGNNVIFDHLSASHTPDICFALTSNSEISDNKTIQHCLMGQSKNALIVGDTTPSSSTDYYEQCSILRNAYYNISHRIPLKGGARIRVDAINNIAHNWSARLIRMDGYAYELNHIGNYYQGGYNTTNVLKHCSYLSSTGSPKIYNEDNYMDPAETTSEYSTDESVVWTEYQNNFVDLPSSYFTNERNTIRGRAIEILKSSELKSVVLADVGCNKYLDDNGQVQSYIDTYDTSFINGINTDDNETRSTVLSEIETLSNSRPNDFYVSNPHIPEAYLIRRGITGNSTIHNQVQSSGYTLLEEYINQVDA